jgi:hypothetical protein
MKNVVLDKDLFTHPVIQTRLYSENCNITGDPCGLRQLLQEYSPPWLCNLYHVGGLLYIFCCYTFCRGRWAFWSYCLSLSMISAWVFLGVGQIGNEPSRAPMKDAIVKVELLQELDNIWLFPIFVHFWPFYGDDSPYANDFFGSDFEIAP